jgi:hypothetical protein
LDPRIALEAAHQLQTQFGITLPTNLDPLLAFHNIPVRYEAIEEEIYGILVIHSAKATIGINTSGTRRHRRVITAILLGHYLLHRYDAKVFLLTHEDFIGETPTPTRLDQSFEAQIFSIELLTPSILLAEHRKARTMIDLVNVDPTSSPEIEALAEKFDVTPNAAHWGLVKQLLWDE